MFRLSKFLGSRNAPRRASRRNRSPRPVLDALEARQLMAFSPFGVSRPDLVVDAFAPPVASVGDTISLVIDVRNLGSTSIVEPLGFFDPRAGRQPFVSRYVSPADAGPSQIQVYLSAFPVFDETAVPISAPIPVPAVPQNTLLRMLPQDGLPANVAVPQYLRNVANPQAVNVAPAIALPDLASWPAGIPNFDGDTVYLFLRADDAKVVAEHDETNNLSRPIPLRLVPALGDFDAVGLDVARGMQPADVVTPNLKVVNYGTRDVADYNQELRVDLTASFDSRLSFDDFAFARFDVQSVAPINFAPTRRVVRGARNVIDPANVTTVPADQIAFPVGPYVRIPNALNGYNFGAVVDPENDLLELSELRGRRAVHFSQLRRVAPPLRGVGPADVIAPAAPRPLRPPIRSLPV